MLFMQITLTLFRLSSM